MKFSFVVPIYKKKLDVVKRCLQSLIDQEHKDIEIISVFDGPDVILESLVDNLMKNDDRVKKLVIEHGGACKARNEGYKVSTGDYVSFWDSDCYAAPGMSAVWKLFFEEDKDLDFLYSDFAFTD